MTNKNYSILQKMKQWPCGLWIFSRIICFKAPYFSTIKPTFTKLDLGIGEAVLKKRRRVQNHIGTVHAIACANLCELVAGTTLEISLPPTHRWIPKGMQIQYLKKAETDLVGKTRFGLDKWPDAGSFNVPVDVVDKNGQVVVQADIEMYVSLKPKK
jgi:hypothetical protein